MLRAGFARIDISPPKENSLLGYEFRQQHLPPGNEGIHDPLYARILVIHDGTKPAAFVSLDLCILLPALTRKLREAAATSIDTTADRVMIACSHTHSGPFPILPDGEQKGFLSTFAPNSQTNPDAAYAAFLEKQLVDAAPRAAWLLFPVRIESQQAPCAIAYTRRHILPDGKVTLIWNPQESKTPETAPSMGELVLTPENSLLPTADPMCTLLALRQTNGPRSFLLWSLGAHPTVMGKTVRRVSADWPGLACTQIDSADANTHSLFSLGPCGDTHAWIATQESYENLRIVASAAAGFVSLLNHATHASAAQTLAIVSKTVAIGKAEVDLSAWRLGSALIISAPVELFAELGAKVRAAFPHHHVIVSTNTQGWTGYWPTRGAFATGDYEVNAAKNMGREPGDGERLADEMIALARSLLPA